MGRLLGLLLLLAILAGGGFLYWRSTHPPPIPVLVHTVGKGRVETIVANTRVGTVQAVRRSKLAPQLGGQVAKLTVREGDRVAAGEVLMELWNDDLAANVRLAESEEARARALVEQAARLAEIARTESERQVELGRRDIASPELVERLVAESKAREAELDAARAAVVVAANRVLAAQAALTRTILRAPFAGVVAEVNCELGEYVTPSPPGIPTLPAIDLIDTSAMFVNAPIDEVDARAVATGMGVSITLDGFPGVRFAGRVSRVAPYVLDREKEARTVDVEVQFTDSETIRDVRPGASADVEILVDAVADVVRVPTEAILAGRGVLVFGGADRPLQERAVATGLANWQFTEVKDGLATGEQVVTSVDREGVRAGALVVPENPR